MTNEPRSAIPTSAKRVRHPSGTQLQFLNGKQGTELADLIVRKITEAVNASIFASGIARELIRGQRGSDRQRSPLLQASCYHLATSCDPEGLVPNARERIAEISLTPLESHSDAT